MVEIAKLVLEKWPDLLVAVIAVLVTIRLVRFEARVSHLEELSAAELNWRIEHVKYADRKNDDLQTVVTNTARLQENVASLAESVRIIRDAQAEMQKFGVAGIQALIAAEKMGLLK